MKGKEILKLNELIKYRKSNQHTTFRGRNVITKFSYIKIIKILCGMIAPLPIN